MQIPCLRAARKLQIFFGGSRLRGGFCTRVRLPPLEQAGTRCRLCPMRKKGTHDQRKSIPRKSRVRSGDAASRQASKQATEDVIEFLVFTLTAQLLHRRSGGNSWSVPIKNGSRTKNREFREPERISINLPGAAWYRRKQDAGNGSRWPGKIRDFSEIPRSEIAGEHSEKLLRLL